VQWKWSQAFWRFFFLKYVNPVHIHDVFFFTGDMFPAFHHSFADGIHLGSLFLCFYVLAFDVVCRAMLNVPFHQCRCEIEYVIAHYHNYKVDVAAAVHLVYQ
jgi:hypothetical protein